MSEDNAEPKEKKRKSPADNATTLRTENMTSGEILRSAREKRRLTLEDVSAAIHVRTAQLRSIEEGNIDALPGMTYAVGFVKSYASYLKLNPIDLGNKFKAEHGALKPLMPDLPEIKPVVESRMPDPRLVGVAAFFAVVVLVGWTFFTGSDSADEVDIASVATEGVAAGVAVEVAPENVTDTGASEDIAAAVETSGSPEDIAADDTSLLGKEKTTSVVKPQEKKVDDKKEESEALKAEEEKITQTSEAEVSRDESEASNASAISDEKQAELGAAADNNAADNDVPAEATASVPVEAQTADGTITIRKPGRVVFKARQPSWIQVSDANERVVFKKLLRAGEQYTVPEGSGYTLITTNAGGLDVMVDGKAAPTLGKSGEILRGLPLEPAELTRVKRVRSRINN